MRMDTRTATAILGLVLLAGCDQSAAPTSPGPVAPQPTAARPVLPEGVRNGLSPAAEMADRLGAMSIELGDPTYVIPTSGTATFSGVMEIADSSPAELLYGDVVLNTRWDNGSTNGVAGDFLTSDLILMEGELEGLGQFAENDGRMTLTLPMSGTLARPDQDGTAYQFTMLGNLQALHGSLAVSAASEGYTREDGAQFVVQTAPPPN